MAPLPILVRVAGLTWNTQTALRKCWMLTASPQAYNVSVMAPASAENGHGTVRVSGRSRFEKRFS